MILLNQQNKYVKDIVHVWVGSQPYLSIRDNKVLTLSVTGSPSPSVTNLMVDNYGRLGRGAAIRNASSEPNFIRMNLDTPGNVPDINNNNFTLLTIVRPINDGTFGNTSDATAWSRSDTSSGGGSADFDFMLGLESSSGNGRFRLRTGGSIVTIVNSLALQQNKLNMLAIVKSPGVVWRGDVLREDGQYISLNASSSSTYTSVSSRRIGIGARWLASNESPFEGDTLLCLAINKALTEFELRDLFINPWQIFQPQRILIPMTAAEVVAQMGPDTTVFVTDVNTTESWDDGDTGIPITGTGFV